MLWGLTTGLYLVGSRAGDEVNLMTANLVVQVSMEPKLVAVALEHESVTARLVRAGEAFSLTVLARADRDVVRRFVKPVVDVERAADGTVTSMSGQPVEEIGAGRPARPGLQGGLPHLPPRTGRRAGQPRPLHRRGDRGGRRTREAEVLRMEDTRMHYGG